MAGNCLGRIRTATCALPAAPAHAPQTLAEGAQQAAGRAVGALQSAAEGLLEVAGMASDSIVQAGNILTAGAFSDTQYVQRALGRQTARGQAMVDTATQIVTDPIGTAAAALESLDAQQQAAEQLRAAGNFYEAGKIEGALAQGIMPSPAGVTKVVRLTPEGKPPKPRGEVVVTKRTTAKAKPECFGRNSQVAKNKPSEYDAQLAAQQNAINSMTVEEYLKNRERFDRIGRAGTSAQALDRLRAIAAMQGEIEMELVAKKMSPVEAERVSSIMVSQQAAVMDILHTPDLVAGGGGVMGGLGDRGVNRSIGSYWGKSNMERVRVMDDVAKVVPKELSANTMMNVELRRC
jgi:hypothetical protein